MRPGPAPESSSVELFSVDAFLRDFETRVTDVDHDNGRIAFDRTAFYPGGGGQPNDVGALEWDGGHAQVSAVSRDDGRIWHQLADGADLPVAGTEVFGRLDWSRRHLLMIRR